MDLPMVLPLLTMVLLWVVLAQSFGFTYPFISRLVCRLAPHLRLSFQMVYSMLPLMIAVTIAVMVFTPVIGGINISGHCHGLDCSAHVPVFHTDPVSAGIISGLLLMACLGTFGMLALSVWRNHRVGGMLFRLSSTGLDAAYNVLETPELIACCVGIIRPRVLISRGVLQQTNPLQLQVIVSHELAHAYRFDNLRRLLASLAVLAWPEKPRQMLLADIELASEQGCDEQVSRLLGNRAIVADVIQAFARWRSAAVPPCGNTEMDNWEARVGVLVTPETDNMDGWTSAMMVVAGSAAFTVIASDLLHRAAETVLAVTPTVY